MTHHRLRWSLVACAAILAAGVLSTAGAFARDDRNPRPTVVLVHGAFADASSWSPVIAQLQDDGFPVVAPANALRGIASDASYLSSFLNTIDGPIVLVGHSYGGAVITNAAAGHSNVKALVYVAAFIPDVGQTLADLSSPAGGSELQPTLILRPCPPQFCALGPEGYIDPTKCRAVFAACDFASYVAQILSAIWRSQPWQIAARQDLRPS